MTSTRERQRAAARARLEREMTERAAKARKRRQTQAIVGAAAVLVLVVAGTVWLVTSLGGDDDKQNTASTPGFSQCGYTELPQEGRPKQIKDVGLPPTQQDNKGSQTMTIDTNLGPITAKINRDQVPCTAGSFTHLASKGFFDNTKCHRLVTEGIKVLQCGDPTATGSGGPGYRFADENLDGASYKRGVLAMANSGPGTNGSQFFIVYGDETDSLPDAYTPFGTITKGMDVVDKVAKDGVEGGGSDGQPKTTVDIKDVTITSKS